MKSTPYFHHRSQILTAGATGRGGLTLIELLVVVAILGLLTVTVIPNISGALDRRRIRDAAGNVSAFVSRAQSRGLNAKEPRGFIIQPLASGTAAIDLFFADTPEAYAGDSTSSRASLQLSPADPSWAFVTFSDGDALTLADDSFCKDGDAIQFGGYGPYFHLTPPPFPPPPPPGDDPPPREPPPRPPAELNQARTGAVNMWGEVNQTPYSMVLPPDGSYTFRIRRQPSRASSGVLQLTNGAAIDLRWCSWGGCTIEDEDLTQPIIVLYDAAGRPSQIQHSGGVQEPIVSPIYLLIGLTDLCGNEYDSIPAAARTASQDDRIGANWQYADAYWVVIDNKTGLARTAPSDAEAANVAGNVLASQGLIRGAIGVSAVE